MDQNSIKQFIAEALRLISLASKEDLMISNFVSYLRKMFPENPLWVNHYMAGIESKVELYRRGRSVSGSIDVFVDGTVIEFEKNLNLTSVFSHGLDQVKEYCSSHIRSGVPIENLVGILSDTLNWYFYKVDKLPGVSFSDYYLSNIKLSLIEEIHITSADDLSAIKLGNALNNYLGRLGARELTSRALSDDFGIESFWGKQYLDDAKVFINSLSSARSDYYSLIKRIWSHFVEGIELAVDSDEDSYVFEFYIATLAKLLCANIFNKKALLSDDTELVEIVSGDFFQRLGYVNFVEYDYFGWINNHLSGSTYIRSLRGIQEQLAIYDYSVIKDDDVFGELLSALSLETKRKLLGQELTPKWLADAVVEKAIKMLPQNEWPKFIDMCCGSGSMLISTVNACSKRLDSSSLSEDKKYEIISSAALGIDIDPLAVLLAKINWIIHTKQYCSSHTEIVIPVYHADSLFISSPVYLNPSSYVISLDGNDVSIPRFLLSSQYDEFFSIIIERIAHSLDDDLSEEDYKYITKSCLDSFRVSMTDAEEKEISSFAFCLYSTLRMLHLKERNGIWAYLIKNSFKPVLLSRKFNGLVSNTPWMALSEVKNNPYKNSLSDKAEAYDIKPTGSSFLHTELATVFLIHSIDSFLKDGAVFGCILPHSVLKGNQHDKFRSKHSFSSSLSFAVSYDEIWELPVDTFPNRAITLFGRKNSNTNKEINGRKYSTPDTYEIATVYEVNGAGRNIWSFDPSGYMALSPNYLFHQGADILPRPFFYFDLKESGSNYIVSALDLNTSDYGYFLKAGKVNYKPSSAIIPKLFFRKTLVSNVVHPFIISHYPLAFIPIKRDPITGKQHVLSKAEFTALPTPVRSLASTLRKDLQKVLGTTDDLFSKQRLDKMNKFSGQCFKKGKYIVVYGAGGANVAAAWLLIDENTSDLVIDQTLYYQEVSSKDEALFVTGLLNSEVLSEAITSYQPSGLFGNRHIHTLPRHFIPKYDKSNSLHIAFVQATKNLQDDLMSTFSSDAKIANLIDPKQSTLQSRRKKLTAVIKDLPTYFEYDRISRLIVI